MNNKIVVFFIALFLGLFFYFKSFITNSILDLFNVSKTNINNIVYNISNEINSHFNQSQKIKQLTQENEQLRNYIEQNKPLLQNYKQLQIFKFINNPNLYFSQAISYAALPDLESLYISYHENNMQIPRGVIYNDTTIGIVIKSFDNYSLMILNTHPKTNYAVFIGKKKVPGIIFGGKQMTIKYIPKYSKIKLNDLVITSGLGNIFYEGIKVGRITKIIQKDLFQEAKVEPFYNSTDIKFFYVIKNKTTLHYKMKKD